MDTLLFEWDSGKARWHLARHRVSFEEAESAFRDPFAVIRFDPDHSMEEDRFFLLGSTSCGRLVAVVFTERENSIRLISARLADRFERRDHEEARQA